MASRMSARREQILVALRAAPLDRVRLMKTLFLFWYRAGKPTTGPFKFRAYLYGPCAFDLYGTLEDLVGDGLVVQAPHAVERWGRYYLTEAGEKAAGQTQLTKKEAKAIAEIAKWAAARSFRSLLSRVYREAPGFATESVLQG